MIRDGERSESWTLKRLRISKLPCRGDLSSRMAKTFFPRDAPRRRSGRGRSGRWGRRGRRRGARGSRRTTGTLPAPSRAHLSAGAAPPPPGAPSPGAQSSVVVTAARGWMGLDPIRRLRAGNLSGERRLAVGHCVCWQGQGSAGRLGLSVFTRDFIFFLTVAVSSPVFPFLFFFYYRSMCTT
jgi:hypothetical protein